MGGVGLLIVAVSSYQLVFHWSGVDRVNLGLGSSRISTPVAVDLGQKCVLVLLAGGRRNRRGGGGGGGEGGWWQTGCSLLTDS